MIKADDVSAKSVAELLKQNLRIPAYQRPYSWEPATALQLVEDIEQARKDPDRTQTSYVLGAVILCNRDQALDIVDGQQRLLTLRMILATLKASDALGLPADGESPVSRVWVALGQRLSRISPDEAEALKSFISDRCEVVQVVTDDEDEAFRVFDSQNYRGLALEPHDLLKAHHLREMRHESPAMKAAVVEAWESAGTDALRRLFATYLYRINRWSRGRPAPGFTVRDVGMFKGVSAGTRLTPAERYHLAAQSTLPLLESFAPQGGDPRAAGHGRFQLDAPIVAGRPFFEMVTFMLEELGRVTLDAYSDAETEPFSFYDLETLDQVGQLKRAPGRHRDRYRYVTELYVAAVLYCVNRFGPEQLDEARHALFAWAYELRTSLWSVQLRSVDNRASGADANASKRAAESAFVALREAASATELARLRPVIEPRDPNLEPALVQLLLGQGRKELVPA